MDKIPDRIDSKFRFVLLSAARAEQMIQGASAKSEGDSPKVTRVAMDEITSDAIDWDYGPAPDAEVEEAIEESDDAEAKAADKA